MNTKLQILVTENEADVGHRFDRFLSDKGYEVSTALSGKDAFNDAEMNAAPEKAVSAFVKTTGMFVAAPFIALAYVIALPFIGIYHFAKLALEAYGNGHPATKGKLKKATVLVKNIGLFFAAPLIALVYTIALPFVGFFMLSKLALEARANRCTIA